MAGEESVAAALARITGAWMEERWDELAELLHPAMVMALPGGRGRLEGRDAVVASFREFMERVTVDSYREGSPDVDVWGTTAVASFRWEMGWTEAAGVRRAAGHDTFVLLYDPEDGEWRPVWRTMNLETAHRAAE